MSLNYIIIIKFNPPKNVELNICIFDRNYIGKYNMIIYYLIVEMEGYFLVISIMLKDSIILFILTNKY